MTSAARSEDLFSESLLQSLYQTGELLLCDKVNNRKVSKVTTLINFGFRNLFLSFNTFVCSLLAEAPLGRKGRPKRNGRKSARGKLWEEGKGESLASLLSFSLPSVPRALAFSLSPAPARLLFLSLQPPRALYLPLPNPPYPRYPKRMI